MNPILIGHRKELFWDDYLVNTSLTGAVLRQHHPRLEELAVTLDMPWEGDGCGYCNIVRDGDLYRMYYCAGRMDNDDDSEVELHGRVCCLESTDGITWTRPALSLRSFPGYPVNNILLDSSDNDFDNFSVFIDENPACPSSERYKATATTGNWRVGRHLWFWFSGDGYRWEKGWEMCVPGKFDSLNVAFWSKVHGKYFCYFRDFHDIPAGCKDNEGIRDVRVSVSEDCRNWSDPELLDFGGQDDIPLYTSAAFAWPGAEGMFVGLPTRYVERKAWTGNFDQLSDPEPRKARMVDQPRHGLATTDCVLMTSRDGFRWNRFDEAWMTPGIECEGNWVYGDCFPTVGVVATRSSLPGAPEELSFYSHTGHWSHKATWLWRYTLRRDGLCSYRADYAPKTLVTKPLLYEGGQLHLNFATSARGYIYVTARCGKETLCSCELFGDTLDRVVPFDGDLEQFRGREVTLEFTMSDADLYAMQFI